MVWLKLSILICAPVLLAQAAQLLSASKAQQRLEMPPGFFDAPSDFINEDAAPAPRQDLNMHVQAPFDVGANAVSLPNSFESVHAWTPPQPVATQPEAKRAVSLAQGAISAASTSSFFDDEDAAPAPRRQIVTGLPSGVKAPPTVLQQAAARYLADNQYRQELLAKQAAMETA